MRHMSSSLPKAIALVVMMMVGTAVVSSTDTPGTAATGTTLSPAMALTACDDPGVLASRADTPDSLALSGENFAPEPVAICRLLPECWVNSDCDARCGTGLGKCVHSNCPVRLCRCR